MSFVSLILASVLLYILLFSILLKNAAKKAGVKGNIGTHSLRKTFGYHHYKRFNDIGLLQKILNHSSSAITLCYIGITQEIIDMSYKNFNLLEVA